MKRILAVVLILCALGPAGALADLRMSDYTLMIGKTQALTALMVECARSQAYVSLYGGSNDMAAAIGRLGAADWSQARGGTVYVLKNGAVESYLAASGVRLSDFPEAVAEKVRQAVPGSIPMALAAQSGNEAVAVASSLRTGDAFTADALFPEYALLLLRYNDQYDVMAVFVKNQANIVSVSVIPLYTVDSARLKQIIGAASLLSGTDGFYDEYPVQ